MDEATLEEIRKLFTTRDTILGYTGRDKTYRGLLASGLITHEEVQTYILLKILDRLERIEWKADEH